MSDGRRSFWGFGRRRSEEVPAEGSAPADAEDAADTGDAADTIPEAGSSEAATEKASEAGTETGDKKGGFFSRLAKGLGRSSSKLGDSVSALFTKKKLDASSLQDLEDILIEADLGIETASNIVDRLSEARFAKGIEADELQEVLADEVETVLAPLALPLAIDQAPFVVLVVGVNGTGKTTTIGKL
ncbi:MAG: signal recognition particle receptor subunit alpha, partial [Pseudomonadota bacterium]